MQLGVLLSHRGPAAGDASMRAAARSADVLGFHSLWAVQPGLSRSEPGPTSPARAAATDGVDAVSAIVTAAEETERVLLGLHLPMRDAARVGGARRLLDAASNRLFVAVDMDDADGHGSAEGGLLEHAVDTVAASLPRPPVQVLVASEARGRGEPIMAGVDGWFVNRSPLVEIASAWARIGTDLDRSGRGPNDLSLFVRADVTLTRRPLSRHRSEFCGSIGQVVDDLIVLADLGTNVTVLAFAAELHLDALLGGYAAIAEGLELRARP